MTPRLINNDTMDYFFKSGRLLGICVPIVLRHASYADRWAFAIGVATKGNVRVIMAAFRDSFMNSNDALQWFRSHWPCDDATARRCVELDGYAYGFCLTEPQRHNTELLYAALRSIGTIALMYAPYALRSNAGVMGTVVSAYGHAVQFAETNLRDDKRFILRAAETNDNTLLWASIRLRRDRDVVLRCCQHNGAAIKWAPEVFRTDAEIVAAALRQNPDVATSVQGLA